MLTKSSSTKKEERTMTYLKLDDEKNSDKNQNDQKDKYNINENILST